jgi:hypothetical protein
MNLEETPESESNGLASPDGNLASATTPPTARSALLDWANEQDAWVRALASEVIVTRAEVAYERIQYFYELLLREKGLTSDGPVQVPALSADPLTLAQGESLIINRIAELQYVNVLSPNQTVDFNPCLTVLFGENASGKSGYVRVLKRAAAVRTAENVLPDIAGPGAPVQTPRAKIIYTHGEQTQTIDWQNEAGIYPLSRMDVFDSRSMQVHVDEDLTYVYTPGELSLFPLIQQGIEKVKQLLEASVSTSKPTSNPFLAGFSRGTSVYPMIEVLGAASNVDELRALADVTELEKAELVSLRTTIEALRSQTPQLQQRLSENERRFLESLKATLDTLASLDLGSYSRARTLLLEARARQEAATKSAFSGVDIPEILSEEWKKLIQAGEDYLRLIAAHEHYPQKDDKCIYCQQDLSADAVILLKKYRDLSNNELREEVVRSENRVMDLTTTLHDLSLEEVVNGLGEHLETTSSESGGGSPLAPLLSLLERAGLLREALVAEKEFEWIDLHQEVGQALRVVDTELQKVILLIANLSDRAQERQRALAESEARSAELGARVHLQELLTPIQEYVEKAKWANKGEAHSRQFQGIFRSLTEASKAASEKLLNQDFETRFNEECTKLHAPRVRVYFPGRQGKVSRRKVVSPIYRLSEILSEGEQKVIALADFLAEVRLKVPVAPIVFDDPITSLDYRRIEEVAGRIVELSHERQVIVFTHNIWFATELLSHFDKQPENCSYYDVQRYDSRVGVVTRGTHPRADTLNSIRGRINALVQDAERVPGETLTALVEKGYEYLRNYCEVFVEIELLQGVSRRLGANIRMTQLPKIKHDRLKPAIDVVNPIYEKCCRQIVSHSQPIETLNIRPTLSEFKEDWQSIQEARARHNSTD